MGPRERLGVRRDAARPVAGAGTLPRRALHERFPGESVWRWQVQAAHERAVAPVRLVVVLATGTAWAIAPHPAGALPALAWTLLALFVAYGLVALFITYGRPDALRRRPDVPPALDLVLAVSWILATGGRQSPFLALSFVAGVTVPMRLSQPFRLPVAAVLAGLLLWLSPPGQGISALYLLVCAGGLAAWSRAVDAIRRTTLHDSLTGSFGRDYALMQAVNLLEREALPFAAALVDLDGFKSINDTYGHLAGDAALRECARRIQAVIRPTDVLARFGGDEFLVVCPDASLAEGLAVAERIRAQVAATRYAVRADARPLRLSVSVGVAEARPRETVTALIGRADQGLYAAKASRDTVQAGAG